MGSYKWQIIVEPNKKGQMVYGLKSAIVWGESENWYTNKIECEKDGLTQIVDLPACWGGPYVYIKVLENSGQTWSYQVKKSFP